MARMNALHAKHMCTALALMWMVIPPAYADSSAYAEVVDLSAETALVRAQHHHDWTRARWKIGSATNDTFSDNNDYAYVRLHDKKTGAELFRRPAPALSHIWISADSRYVVGISNIMYLNPYQLVVFSKSGERLLERSLINVKWPGVSRSVTNWISWYKEPVPKISIAENGAMAKLTIQDQLGVPREFHFHAAD